MSLFQYLQLQEVEPEDADSALDYFERDDIELYAQTDGDDLASAWGAILQQSEDTDQ